MRTVCFAYASKNKYLYGTEFVQQKDHAELQDREWQDDVIGIIPADAMGIIPAELPI